MVACGAVRLGSAIRVGQDAALGEDGGGVLRQQHDSGGGGVVLAPVRVVPDKAAQQGAGEKVLGR